MNNTHSTPTEIDKIQIKLEQLFAAYHFLKLNDAKDPHHETLKAGFLLNAGKNAEMILKFICIREGIKPRAIGAAVEDRRPPMLNDYIHILRSKEIFNNDIHHHFDIIKKWRNRNAHDYSSEITNSENIRPSTIESVYDSLCYITEWFFRFYLKTNLPGFVPRQSVSEVTLVESSAFTNDEINNGDKPAINVETGENEKKIVTLKKGSTFSKYLVWALVLCVLGSGYYMLVVHDNRSIDSTEKDSAMSRDQVYNFLVRYMMESNSDTFNARAYFADKVEQYYLTYDQTPEQIKSDPSKRDFQNPKCVIDKNSLVIRTDSDGIALWRFWCDFTCFRPSHQRYQKSHVLMEYGINEDHKITCIRQIQLQLIY